MSRSEEEFSFVVDLLAHPPRRANPVLLLWRWRYEVASVLTAVGAVRVLSALPAGLTVLVLALGALLPLLRPIRLLLRVRCRGVLVQHRIRSACRAARIHNNRGRMPALLWTRPRARAERVLVWLPAGLTVARLEKEADAFAAACYASRTEVIAHHRRRHLAWIVLVHD